jgi:methyl coenzyme M reductase alpha subunit
MKITTEQLNEYYMLKSKKDIWFKYLTDNKKHWPNGFTLKRLEKVKSFVLTDKDIMFDLMERHSGNELTPEEMKEDDVENFNHCISNFAINILYKMRELNIIK